MTTSVFPETHWQQGVSIGDVGIIDHSGGFEFYFNIFYPRNHPIQNLIPRNFRPMEPPLSEWKIQSTVHFEPGTILTSEGISQTKISDQPLEIEFTSYAREGAVLIFPEGATREELVETHKLYSYVKEHAPDWYQVANGYSDFPTMEPNANGTLFLVTGTDKAKIWDNVAFPPNNELARPTIFRYMNKGELGRDLQENPGSRIHGADEMGSSTEGKFPCALFIRGITFALHKAEFAHGVAPIPLDLLPIYYIPSVPAYGKRADRERFIQCFRRGPSADQNQRRELMFHPSFVLLQILLEIDPAADVAIIEDSIWCHLMEGRSLMLTEFKKLVDKVVHTYDITTTDGIVQFIPKGNMNELQLTLRQKLGLYMKSLFATKSQAQRTTLRKLKKILTKPEPLEDW